MSSNSNTTIVFVPGAWHGPEGFYEVSDKLRSAGYQTDFVSLASVGPKEHLKDMTPDIEVIRQHVEKAVNQGQKVVVVMHSYGGLPTQEAVHGLEYKTRQAEGKAGGVTHLFFLASFIIPQGASLVAAFGGNPLPWFDISADEKEVNPMTPENIFYNDLPEDKVKEYVAALKPFSWACLNTPLKVVSWKQIPSTYLYCTNDNAIPISIQKMMVEEIAKGADIRTEEIDASHSPFWSKPEETAAAIQRAAEIAV